MSTRSFWVPTSAAPSGSAGGDLTGTYPNPTVASDKITNAKVKSDAAIAYSKLALGTSIVNADVSASAAIAESKLSLASDAAVGTASRRTLGTTSTQAAPGDDVRILGGINLWRTVAFLGGGFRFDAQSAATFVGGNAQASGASAGSTAFYLDPADYAVTGYTTQMRLQWSCLANATASTSTFACGLYPVSAVAGGAAAVTVTLGTVVSNSTVTFTTPAANSITNGVSSTFTHPAAGLYICAIVVTGNMAASSSVYLKPAIQVRVA